jgi:hypothetical protein
MTQPDPLTKAEPLKWSVGLGTDVWALFRPDDPPWATPLAWATRRKHPAIADLLRKHGAH